MNLVRVMGLLFLVTLFVQVGCQKKTVEYGGASEPDQPKIEYSVEPEINRSSEN